MKTMQIYLQGHITVPMDRLEQVRQALPEHIALTRAEEGCLSFDVVEDCEQPGRFYVSEEFENQAAFDVHQERTTRSSWFEIKQGISREYCISTG